MLLHRREDAQIPLHAPRVVITDVLLNHGKKGLFVRESFAIVAFPFQNAPEAFHRAVIDTVCHTGHALLHTGLLKFAVKCTVRILEAPVTVKQRMCVGVCLYRPVKSLEYQRIVVALAEDKGNDTPVVEVENGAEVNFMDFSAFVPLEFCHIGKPFFIWLFGMKLASQKIFGEILWILCLPGAAVTGVLDGGHDIFCAADAQDPLIVNVDVLVMPQIIIDTSVAFVGTFCVDFLNLFGKPFVLGSPAAEFAGRPLIVGGARHRSS